MATIKKLQINGLNETLKWLIDSGFPPDDAENFIQISAHIIAAKQQRMRELEEKSEESNSNIIINNQPKFTSFNSSGIRLGGDIKEEPIFSITEQQENETIKNKTITLNPDQPQTRIRVRLLNGKQETIKLNTNHTIEDLKYHVESLSGVLFSKFNLATSMPRIVYTDYSQTISDAGISNASLIQERN